MLQVYELRSRPVRAERCLFLPMEVVTFTATSREDDVVAFAEPLADAARAMGRATLAEAIVGLEAKIAGEKARVSALEAVRAGRQEALRQARDVVEEQTSLAEEAGRDLVRLEREGREATLQRNEALANQSRAASKFPPDFALLTSSLAAVVEASLEIARIEAEKVLKEQVQRSVDGPRREYETRFAELEAVKAEIAAEEAAALLDAQATIDELNEEKLAFNQAMWLSMTSAAVGTMLEAPEYRNTPLLETVDPAPVAVFGTWVGFRWSFPDDERGRSEAAAFEALHLADHAEPAIDTRVMPTGGVFAEAMLGRANAAEKLDLTRYWQWDDDTIPILPTAIERLRSTRRARRTSTGAGELGEQAVSLGALSDAPDGPSRALAGVVGASMFRDMSGAGAVADLLQEGQKQAAAGSKHAMQVTHENIGACLDHLEVVLPEVLKMVGPGKLNPSKLGALGDALGGAGGPGGGAGGGQGPSAQGRCAGQARRQDGLARMSAPNVRTTTLESRT